MQQIKFDRKGNVAAILSDDGRLKVWDRASGFLLNDVNNTEIIEDIITDFIFAANSNRLIISVESGHIFIVDLVSKQIVLKKLISRQNPISCLETSKKGDIFAGTRNGELIVFDKNLEISKKIQILNSQISILKVNFEATKLFIGARNSFIFDLISFTSIFSVPLFYTTFPISAAFSGDRLLILAELEAAAMLIDLSGQKILTAPILLENQCKNCSMSTKHITFTGKNHNFLALNTPKSLTSNYTNQVIGGNDILASFCDENGIILVRNSHFSPKFEIFSQEIPSVLQKTSKKIAFEEVSEKFEKSENIEVLPENVIFGAQNSEFPQKISNSGAEFLDKSSKNSSISEKIREVNKISDVYDFSENSENLSLFLINSIISKDQKMLEKVLKSTPKNLIESTVKTLPVKFIINFLGPIIFYFKSSSKSAQVAFPWLKYLLIHHSSYIQSSVDCQAILRELYSIISGNVTNFLELNRIHGKLDLILKKNNNFGNIDFEPEIEFLENFEENFEDLEESSEEISEE